MKSIFYISVLCGFFSTRIFAGWASGGGMIHKDELNPWFLENTKVVHFCIDIDEQNFGISTSEARGQIEWALKEWKSAFDVAEDSYYEPHELEPYDNIHVATQKFIEVSCSQLDVDLRFQLGTLTAEQINLFEKPEDYIGIAFRTNYKLENMKGRGFVYLAPTKGTLKPNNSDMMDDAWSQHNSLALKLVLIHELGHVFGIAHTPNTVMDTLLPEMLITRDFLTKIDLEFAAYMTEYYSLSRLFGYKETLDIEGCGDKNPIRDAEVFELGPRSHDTSCGRVVLSMGTENPYLNIYYAESGNLTQMKLIASATLPNLDTRSQAALSIFLPPEQKVFRKFENLDVNGRLFGEQVVSRKRFSGTLEILSSGLKLPIRILLSQEGSEFTLIYNNDFRDDAINLDR